MRRVVITGVGLVTPLGVGVAASWAALLRGQSGVAPITLFDASAHRTRIAGEVKGFDPEAYMDRRKTRECDRFTQFALAAAQMAWDNAGLDTDSPTDAERDRIGVILGSGMGGLGTIEAVFPVMVAQGPKRITPYFIPATIANLAAGQVAMRFKLRGVNFCTTSACASGAHAIGEAFRKVQYGKAPMMVAGGAEATVTALAIGGFNAMLALSTRNDDPTRASRPWDRDRDGFVLGEGAGVVVLEDRDRAIARGATIVAEIVGYGASDDAHHLTQPAPGGEGAQRAMREALDDGGIDPTRVGYINAHGTSTPQGDVVEDAAVRAVFGDHATRLAMSSTKSMTGHLLGAAGAVETVFTAMAIREGVLPPTINLDAPGEGCDLDHIPHEARKAEVDVALNNSFGFGGTNVSLAIARHQG